MSKSRAVQPGAPSPEWRIPLAPHCAKHDSARPTGTLSSAPAGPHRGGASSPEPFSGLALFCLQKRAL